MEIFICTQLLFLSKAIWIRNEIYLAPALAGELMLSHLVAAQAVNLTCHQPTEEPGAKPGTPRGGTKRPTSRREWRCWKTQLRKTSCVQQCLGLSARGAGRAASGRGDSLHFVSMAGEDPYRCT